MIVACLHLLGLDDYALIYIGLSALMPDDVFLSFFNRADAALYETKRSGRDAVRYEGGHTN